jgi:toxin ParE1/3/4
MSKRRIRRTRQVADDLIGIYLFIHRRGPQGAERVLSVLERNIRSLADMPGVGRLWDTPDPRLEGMRVTVVTPFRNYLIFFRPTPDAIEVFRVVQGSQELDRIVDEIDVQFEDDE